LSEVIEKNGGGRMLEQPLLMSSALRASARNLGFLIINKFNIINPTLYRKYLLTGYIHTNIHQKFYSGLSKNLKDH